jgi:hypothetical protein
MLISGVVALSAQNPPSARSPAPRQQASGHAATDADQRAAVYALMHGDWRGTMTLPNGASNAVTLKVAKDDAGNVTFRMTGDRSVQLGVSNQFAVEGRSVRWTQDVSGKPCQVSIRLGADAPAAPDLGKGMISCAETERALALHKDQ